MNNKLVIFDTTLRDGEQSPGASMTLRQKLEVAQQLARLKVDVIEGGFPVISQGDFDAVHAIASEVTGISVAGLARCVAKDIDAAAAAVKPAGARGRIHVFLATSKIHREFKLGKATDEILRLAVEGVKHAKSLVDDVEFSPEDASRTEPEFLIDVCNAVIEAGARTVNIPDTVGYTIPEEFSTLIARLAREVEAFRTGKAIISVHCHNDLGLAVANSLAAIRAGARQVECTINGLGERAGNAALEELVMAIRTRSDFFAGIDCGIEAKEIVRSSKIVSRASGFAVQKNKAIVGGNAFAHASGIHQDGMLKNRNTYEIMQPEYVGWGETDLSLTKHSGRAAVSARLKALGFRLSDNEVTAVFNHFKEIGDKKKYVYDEDLIALAGGLLTAGVCTWELENIQYMNGRNSIPTATIILKKNGIIPKGEPQVTEFLDADTGDGPVDAVFQTIKRITDRQDAKLTEFTIRATSGGEDAVGEVTVRLSFCDGKEVLGRGASTDIIEASARAFISAINRQILIEGADPLV